VTLLAKAFLERYADENRKRSKGLPTRRLMPSYSMPGGKRSGAGEPYQACRDHGRGNKDHPVDLEMEAPRSKYEAMGSRSS